MVVEGLIFNGWRKDFWKDLARIDGKVIFCCERFIPRFVIFIPRISAIITKERGSLSHAAIVSKEFGILVFRTDSLDKILEYEGKRGVIIKENSMYYLIIESAKLRFPLERM